MGNKITKKYDSKQINIEDYVNIKTGEPLTLEQSGVRMTIKEESGMAVLQSDDYVVIDSESLNQISKLLSTSELGHTLTMTTLLKTELNLIYNNNIPHTNETLQRYLGFSSQSMFFKLVKKLIKVGVLYQIKGRIMGEVRVIYMFNPLIARKRKTIDRKIIAIFNEVKETYESQINKTLNISAKTIK